MLHAHAFRFAGYGIFDGLDGDIHDVADLRAAITAIEVERERHVERVKNFRERGDNDFKGHATHFSATNLQQRIALLARGSLIEHQAARSVAFVNRLGPTRGESDAE